MKVEKALKAMMALGLGALAAIAFFYTQAFWPSLFLVGMYGLTLSLGTLLFLAIQNLTGANWHKGMGQVPETMTKTFWIFAPVVLVSFFFASDQLHSWVQLPRRHQAGFQTAWLSQPFAFFRTLIYLAVWGYYVQRSHEFSAARRNLRLSATYLIVFGVTFSLAMVDWLMSVEPGWTSTVFCVYAFSGVYLSALSALVFFTVSLRKMGYLKEAPDVELMHDLGKLIFGFSLFWAYLWYCQYMLIWYTNFPEEITFYLRRHAGGWAVLSFTAVGLNWFIPFLVLLPSWTKRSEHVLLRVSLFILLGHWLDLYVILMPLFSRTTLFLAVLEGLLFLAGLALFARIVFKNAAPPQPSAAS